jgi:hypothetical protein
LGDLSPVIPSIQATKNNPPLRQFKSCLNLNKSPSGSILMNDYYCLRGSQGSTIKVSCECFLPNNRIQALNTLLKKPGISGQFFCPFFDLLGTCFVIRFGLQDYIMHGNRI